MHNPTWAIIGGTGLYQLADFEAVESVDLDTPYGSTSAPIRIGRLADQVVAFLARHGERHQYAPHRVNYRANLWALREIGARRVLAVNAVGGIAANCPPQALVLPDQLIDYTWGRTSSFADEKAGEVRHIDFSEPYTRELRQAILAAADVAGVGVVNGGTYAVTQGPRLETCAEIARLARDGATLVGMTGMPEAALARELELDYVCLAVVANWAAGLGEGNEITMAEIEAHLAAAFVKADKLLTTLLQRPLPVY
jgi:5'-methylthioinosine phosphorylase